MRNKPEFKYLKFKSLSDKIYGLEQIKIEMIKKIKNI